MEARSQSVAHPNENEFHFQLECLLIEDDAANPLAVPMTSSQHVYEVRPRSDERGCDLTSDCIPDCLWAAIPQATEWERIGSQITAAIVAARANVVNVVVTSLGD